ncbi:hypothetical protein Sste5346_005081 [Sporothrix stenoceras]|uniref:Uncharacterized protein n=1 Tax=Sporothrix stenoceras TaxID=5173 RepID=A0ABR3Z5X7_9PEZI
MAALLGAIKGGQDRPQADQTRDDVPFRNGKDGLNGSNGLNGNSSNGGGGSNGNNGNSIAAPPAASSGTANSLPKTPTSSDSQAFHALISRSSLRGITTTHSRSRNVDKSQDAKALAWTICPDPS